jgi:hypothetical protein
VVRGEGSIGRFGAIGYSPFAIGYSLLAIRQTAEKAHGAQFTGCQSLSVLNARPIANS